MGGGILAIADQSPPRLIKYQVAIHFRAATHYMEGVKNTPQGFLLLQMSSNSCMTSCIVFLPQQILSIPTTKWWNTTVEWKIRTQGFPTALLPSFFTLKIITLFFISAIHILRNLLDKWLNKVHLQHFSQLKQRHNLFKTCKKEYSWFLPNDVKWINQLVILQHNRDWPLLPENLKILSL